MGGNPKMVAWSVGDVGSHEAARKIFNGLTGKDAPFCDDDDYLIGGNDEDHHQDIAEGKYKSESEICAEYGVRPEDFR